jgi:hypothetical protein
MSFSDFAADDPSQIVMGLFRGEAFIAVFMFHQVSVDTFGAHFTAPRNAPKDAVLAAGRWLVNWFLSNHLHLQAFVSERNKPLRRWVEAVGLTQQTTGQNDTDGVALRSTMNPFIEYGV